MAPSVGDTAPAIALKDQTGTLQRLSKFKGGPVVVYFYPKADTSGCTAQACALRDGQPELNALGATVLGISPDQPEKLTKFIDKYDLNFSLLSDPEHAIAEAYGVWAEKSLYGRKYMGIVRSAFVIDAKGKIAGAFPKISPKDTVPKVTAILNDLR